MAQKVTITGTLCKIEQQKVFATESSPEERARSVKSLLENAIANRNRRFGHRITHSTHFIPEELIKIFQHKLQPWTGMSPEAENRLATIWKWKSEGLCPNNYKDYFSVILYAEELVREMRMYHYDMFDEKLHQIEVKGRPYFRLTVPGIIDKSPTVIIGNTLMACKNSLVIDFEVIFVNEQEVYLRHLEKFGENVSPNVLAKSCDIHFHLNRCQFHQHLMSMLKVLCTTFLYFQFVFIFCW